LQVPAFNQANWQVPTNYNWNLLDKIFGGEILVPALHVHDLTADNFTITNLGAAIAAACVQEVPSGSYPGTVYTLSHIPNVIMGLYLNGLFLIPGVHYTHTSATITLTTTTSSGDNLYAVYF
jgi:hypothetical protein